MFSHDTGSGGNPAPRESARQSRHQTPLAPLPEYFDAEPAPFSEPVILFAAFLAMTVLLAGYQLKLCVSFMGSNMWNGMTDPGFGWSYTPVLEPFAYLELIVKGGELLATMALLILLLRKNWSFMKWVRVYLLAGLVYQVVEIVAVVSLRMSLPNQEIGRPFNLLFEPWFWVGYALFAFVWVFVNLIWLAYFEKSEQVRKIFIS